MASARVVSNLVHQFQTRPPTDTISLLRQFPTPTLNALIIAVPHPPAATPHLLLRALWTLPSLRPTILTTLATTHNDTISDLLLDEIHLLLTGDARDMRHSVTDRLQRISHMATSLLSDAVRLKGRCHLALPMLIFLASACSAVSTPAAFTVRRKIMSCIYHMLSEPSYVSTRSIAALLEDPLANPAIVHRILKKHLEQCPTHQLPPLLRTLLNRLNSRMHFPDVIVSTLCKQSPQKELLLVLELAFLERPHICNSVLDALTGVITPDERHPNQKCPTAILPVLFCILRIASERVKDRLYGLLERILHYRNVQFDLSAVASSSNHDEAFIRQSVWADAVRIAAQSASAESLLHFFETQMWKPKSLHSACVRHLVYQIFVWSPHSRGAILRSIFAALTETHTPANVLQAFSLLLKELVDTPNSLFSFRDCHAILPECLDSTTIMFTEVACFAVVPLVTVFVSLPSLRDRLMLFLRKISGSRSSKHLRLACAAIVALLSQPNVDDDIYDEVSKLLVTVYETCECDDRMHVLETLLCKIESHSIRPAPLQMLCTWILSMLCTGMVSSVTFDLSRWFSLVGDRYVRNHPVPVLLKCCALLKNHSTKAAAFLSMFLRYLGDENGAISEIRSSSHAPVPVAERIKLLSETLETCFGLQLPGVNNTHLTAYATCLIIHQSLSSGSSFESKPDSKKKMVNVQFASVVARENESPNLNGTVFLHRDEDVVVLSRVRALEFVGKTTDQRNHLHALLVRAEALKLLQEAVRAALSRKDIQLDQGIVKRMVHIVRRCFSMASPWWSTTEARISEQTSEFCNIHGKQGDNATVLTTSDVSADQISADVSSLESRNTKAHQPESEINRALNPELLQKIEDPTRVQVRELSLKVFQDILSHNLVENEDSTLLELIENEGAPRISPPDKMAEAPSLTSSVTSNNEEGERAHTKATRQILVAEGLMSLFKREFANSLSIGLTVTYLAVISRVLDICNQGVAIGVSSRVSKLISSTLLEILQIYSIRHTTVMRSMLVVLLKSIDKKSGVIFAKNTLIWLGNDPCLLNSRYVIEEDERPTRLMVDDFDADILEEALAIDNGEDIHLTRERVGVKRSRVTRQSTANDISKLNVTNGSETMECASRLPPCSSVTSVEYLCLNETPELALLSITRVLDFCEKQIQIDLSSLRSHGKRPRYPIQELMRQEISVSKVTEAISGFFETEFITSVSPHDCRIPMDLLKKISGILHLLMEFIELNLDLLREAVEAGVNRQRLVDSAVLTSQIFKLVYDSCASQALLGTIIDMDGGAKRHSLQERIGVAAASFLQIARRRRISRKLNTTDAITILISQLKEHSQKSFEIRSLKAPADEKYGLLESYRLSRPRKRQRLRSRNAHIDECLGDWIDDERDDDNYAELESFIAPMDEDL